MGGCQLRPSPPTSRHPKHRLRLLLSLATALVLGSNSSIGNRQSRYGTPIARAMLGQGWFRSPQSADRLVVNVQWVLALAFLATCVVTGVR